MRRTETTGATAILIVNDIISPGIQSLARNVVIIETQQTIRTFVTHVARFSSDANSIALDPPV